jgi:lipopolysaccharide/colanic/teichoic acid biosynthesis glycosyltransferase
MIILGEKYTFTELEIQRLEKKFSTIHSIPYKNKNAEKIIADIETILNRDSFKIIVLNTKAKVDDKIITYLTNLRFDDRFKQIKLIDIERFLEKYLYKCYIPEDHTNLHYLDDIKPYTFWQYLQKRAIDFFGIFWLFLFSFPVMQKCKRKIIEESPGPIYFKQMRVGVHNKDFECIKFRSMHIDTEFFSHYTQTDDPRIFPWGKIMRQRRYDELPQMYNILKGDMHLIGPRAEWNELVKQYEKTIPYYNERHIVRPGITGWAQVMYPYGENLEDTKQKLMYDLYYIKYWNIWMDFKIVWKTAMVVLHKKGM